ncbi:OmpG porin family protein [Klebsiella spallanzanii]|uniref:OmpG porin family protein n=1 Tax=Klebsiella spallanzanii TaxID=2587528 RepID=UPI0011705552|nr:OmpG porin family protein [Klebsiella spallanzanii]VUS74185.1 hypothetical protein SB6419_04189 [Klebsiella spallanzanii]
MDEIISPLPFSVITSREALTPGVMISVMLSSLMSFSALAGESNVSLYSQNYQSYFSDESEAQETKNIKPPENKTVVQHSANDPANEKLLLDSDKANTSPVLKTEKKESVPERGGVLLTKTNDVSLLRLRQDDPPVHWNGVGRNMEAGGLHGNIGTQIEIDDVRWGNNQKNGGKFKLATIQAFLRHDELPNWYFGFWNAREDDYKGQFSNQDYSGSNTINEFFVGHIFETWRGNIGAEVMGGSETATKRWKSRFKLWQDLRLSDKWSLAGYVYGEYQPQGNQPQNGDLEQYIFETEPSIQYRVNPDLGLYLRPYYYYNRQEREQWGDIIEREWKVTAGLWKNWYPLLTSLYVGVGQDKTTNASNTYELFYDGRYKFIGGTISYPVFGEVRLYSEFKASFTKQSGAWTSSGHSWNPFTVVGVVYNF